MIIRPGIALAIVGVGAYFIALVASVPASWLAWGLSRTNIPTELNHVHGSIWNGQGRIYLKTARGSSIALPMIDWHLNPLLLIVGQVGIKAQGQNAQVDLAFNGTAGANGINFSRLHLAFPLDLLATAYAPLSYAGIDGRVTIASEGLFIGRNKVAGDADVNISTLKSRIFGTKPLGSYQIKAKAENNIINASLATSAGALVATGNAVWKPLHSGAAQIDATIDTSQLDPDTASMVRRLGTLDGNGNVRWRWSGIIRP